MLGMVENAYCPSFYVELATTDIIKDKLTPDIRPIQGTDVIPVSAVCNTPNDTLQFIIAHGEGVFSIAHLLKFRNRNKG